MTPKPNRSAARRGEQTAAPSSVLHVERREHQRLAVTWSGSLIVGGRDIGCTIANISASGALVLVAETLPPETELTLRVDRRGLLPARVVWQGPDRLGLKFRDTPQQVAKLIGLNGLIAGTAEVAFIPL